MIYEFDLGNKVNEATRNICRVKCEGAVDHATNFARFAITKKIRLDQVGLKGLIPRLCSK